MEEVEYKNGKTIKDIDFNQRQLIEVLNHRMTGVEENIKKLSIDVAWMKKIGYYMAGIITAIATKLIFL